MRREHEEAEHLEIVLLADLPHRLKVAERLGHLDVVDVQKCVVHPVAHKLLAAHRLRLRNLVLVVREHQVLAAAVDVNRLAEILLTHDRALNVPARPSLAPGRLPVGLAFLLRLPEHEVVRILLCLLAAHLEGS